MKTITHLNVDLARLGEVCFAEGVAVVQEKPDVELSDFAEGEKPFAMTHERLSGELFGLTRGCDRFRKEGVTEKPLRQTIRTIADYRS
jgi:hypothetical protein